mgnify:CR=1 FL=1
MYEWDPVAENIYFQSIKDCFNICENNDVLEIAPFLGTHTQLILSNKPKSVTLVENDNKWIPKLKQLYTNCDIIENDIFEFIYSNNKKFDVVICCGFLYHLHHPFCLLELIANKLQPKYMIIETFDFENLKFIDEYDNKKGARQVKNMLSCNLTLSLPINLIQLAISRLNYTRLTYNIVEKPPQGAKAHFMVYQKQ